MQFFDQLSDFFFYVSVFLSDKSHNYMQLISLTVCCNFNFRPLKFLYGMLLIPFYNEPNFTTSNIIGQCLGHVHISYPFCKFSVISFFSIPYLTSIYITNLTINYYSRNINKLLTSLIQIDQCYKLIFFSLSVLLLILTRFYFLYILHSTQETKWNQHRSKHRNVLK